MQRILKQRSGLLRIKPSKNYSTYALQIKGRFVTGCVETNKAARVAVGLPGFIEKFGWRQSFQNRTKPNANYSQYSVLQILYYGI